MACTVVTRRADDAWPAEERLDGVRVLRVAPSGPARSGKYRMVGGAVGALLRRAQPFDLLVVRGTRVLGLPGLLAARLAGKPVVLQPEVNGEMSGEVYWWGTRFDRGWTRTALRAGVGLRNLWLSDADAFVAMSRRIREEMLLAGVPRERVVLIPHGVDTERFRPAAPGEARRLRESLALSPEATIVTYTGRLLRGKGLESALDAFARLAATRKHLHLVLVGSGAGQSLSVEDQLRRSATEGALAGRVTFTGRVENVEEYLRASDVFVFPSVFEALGLSLIEAAATGLPAVGARTGGIVDVIDDGASGFLFTPDDAADLAAKLAPLVDDAELRRRLGERARSVAAERFSERLSVERYRELFLELTAASRIGGRRAAR
jgi:glycosyltransferase involved in cell wall biosynthesis